MCIFSLRFCNIIKDIIVLYRTIYISKVNYTTYTIVVYTKHIYTKTYINLYMYRNIYIFLFKSKS